MPAVPSHPPSNWRWVLVVLGAGMAGCVLLSVAVAVLWRPALEWLVLRRAAEAGIELRLRRVDLAWGQQLGLDQVHFRLHGVSCLEGQARRVELRLRGVVPVRVMADQVKVTLKGAPAELGAELEAWLARHPGVGSLQFEARAVDLSWHEQPAAADWLSARAGSLIRTATGLVFTAPELVLAGVRVGQIGADWNTRERCLEVGLGATTWSRAPVRIRVRYGLASPTAELELAELPVERLARLLDIKLPAGPVRVSGTAHLVQAGGVQGGTATGEVKVKLVGWVPPHPQQLDGLGFGSETQIETRFQSSDAYRAIKLEDLKLRAGALQLGGTGNLTRHDHHWHVGLELRGNLPCTAVASAAAQSYLGRLWGRLGRRAAATLIKGSVAIGVKVEADTSAPGEARIIQTVGNGCGLRPSLVPDLGQLELPKLRLPKLPSLTRPTTEEAPSQR